jgi:hypothetical protein
MTGLAGQWITGRMVSEKTVSGTGVKGTRKGEASAQAKKIRQNRQRSKNRFIERLFSGLQTTGFQKKPAKTTPNTAFCQKTAKTIRTPFLNY